MILFQTVLKEDAITVALQVVLENIESSVKIKILEIGKSPNLLHSQVAAILRREPSVIVSITTIYCDGSTLVKKSLHF